MAQTYIAKMEHFDIYEGLSHRFVTNLIQVDPNNLWIGTKNGLNRFDGFKFTVFTPENSALRQGAIGYMHAAPDGLIYLYTNTVQHPGLIADVQCLNPESMTFCEADPALVNMVDSVSTSKLKYLNGVLYTGSRLVYSFHDKKIRPINIPSDFNWGLTIFHFATNLGFNRPVVDLLHPDHIQMADQAGDPIMTRLWNAISSGTIVHTYSNNIQFDTSRNLLWVEQPGGLVAIDSLGRRIVFSGSSSILNFPRAITSIIAGDRMLIGTESGIYIVSVEKARFRNYFVKKEYGGLLNKSGNRAVLVDRDTLYTCLDNGFFRCPVTHPEKVDLIRMLKKPRNLVYYNKDEILIGSGGVQLYNLRQGVLKERPCGCEGTREGIRPLPQARLSRGSRKT
jgi:hypothetical protein